MTVPKLYAAVIEWLISTGLTEAYKKPGLSSRTAPARGGLPEITVELNPHRELIAHLPPFHFALIAKEFFPGVIAIFGPDGGEILASPVAGEDEASLEAHFRALIAEGVSDDQI